MKKMFLPLLVLAAVGAQASESAPTRRYLIEERASRAALRQPLAIDQENRVDSLTHLNVVIADLTDAEVKALRHSGTARLIEPDREVKAFGTTPQTNARNRAGQSLPYGIELVKAPAMWTMTRGAGIKVAVVDSGIDMNHPDLKANIRGGKDFVNNDDDPQDDNGHGTHVAGTVGAIDNSVGVIGVAPEVDLYALKVLNAKGSGSLSNIIRAVDWAIENKMNIISLSLGSQESSEIEERAFQRAADAGVLAIAASGNDYDSLQADGIAFPAGYSSVVSVGAVDRSSQVAAFSQRGANLSVVAPGVSVLSTYPVGTAFFTQVKVGSGFSVDGNAMTGSPQRPAAGKLVAAGLGKKGEFTPAVRGNIALIKRGELTFAEKAKNAVEAGAIGVIVYNREAGSFGGTLYANADAPTPAELAFPWPPTVSVSLADGEEMLALVGNDTSLAFGVSDDYNELQGTSMATPHVSGVAALIWSLAPSATANQIRLALTDTAQDVGDFGRDTVFGAGIVDANAAAHRVSPQSFPSVPRRRSVRP